MKMRFRKKPEIIEAFQFNEDYEAFPPWFDQKYLRTNKKIEMGDWVVKYSDTEYVTCVLSNEDFKKNYEFIGME